MIARTGNDLEPPTGWCTSVLWRPDSSRRMSVAGPSAESRDARDARAACGHLPEMPTDDLHGSDAGDGPLEGAGHGHNHAAAVSREADRRYLWFALGLLLVFLV